MSRICRFDAGRYGLVIGERVFDVDHLASNSTSPAHKEDRLIQVGQEVLRLFGSGGKPENLTSYALSDVRLLSPVSNPSKIVAASDNYRAHRQEMAEGAVSFGRVSAGLEHDGIFLKATSSLAGPSDGITLRFPERRTDHEVELVAIIGTSAAKVSRENALDHVAGYCIGLDVTLRGPEERSLRKSIDGFSVVGPWMVTADEIQDPQNVELSLQINGETKQHGSTADMVNGVARLIEYASSFYTLLPGDILFTGTPAGVGPIRSGQILCASCDRIGSMSVRVHGGLPTT